MKKQIKIMQKATSLVLCGLLCPAAMLGSCAQKTEQEQTDFAYSGTRIVGQVTKIEDKTVTLTLGELTENAAPDTEQGAKPDGQAPGDENGQPPEKPDGGSESASDGEAQSDENGQPPEKPDGGSENAPGGEAPSGENGQPPEKPDGAAGTQSFTAGQDSVTVGLGDAAVTKNGSSVTVEAIAVGDILQIEFDASGATKTVTILSLGAASGGGAAAQGDSANTITEDGTYTDTVYASSGDDENALRVDGATVTLSGVTVEKNAGATSNTENGDFYGVNAALLATGGATLTLKNATVTSSAQNGNGVFSYGSGTTVNISDSTITTTADNSGGIQTTGGGTTNAENLTVTTGGNSSAAIRSDRGGGTVNVSGGSYVSNGYNSPVVYSTAQISVKNATLTANNSESLVIEGENSIVLENCTVSGNMSDDKGTSSDENVHNVMTYQSMSGDAKVGTSVFSMSGGSLTAKNGDQFYITNTRCELTLCGVRLTSEDVDGVLLRVAGNSASHGWGTAGQNGAQVIFIADGQTLSGDIVVDSISTLTMTLKNGSDFTGVVQIIENAEGGAAVENNVSVTVEQGCTWTLTGDCTLTSLENNGTINFGGYTMTLADGTVLR